MAWSLFWETTQNKEIETAWQRFSLIPAFTSPVSANNRFLIRATSSKLAASRYLFGGWVAKIIADSSVGNFLISPQRFWLNKTIFCELSQSDLASLWFQPAARLNDLTLTIWSD